MRVQKKRKYVVEQNKAFQNAPCPPRRRRGGGGRKKGCAQRRKEFFTLQPKAVGFDRFCLQALIAKCDLLSESENAYDKKLPVLSYCSIIGDGAVVVAIIFRTSSTVLPGGLRRWLQAPVHKGVGSIPTGGVFFYFVFLHSSCLAIVSLRIDDNHSASLNTRATWSYRSVRGHEHGHFARVV